MSKKKAKKQKEESQFYIVSQTAMAWCIDQGYKVYPIPSPSCKGKTDCNKYKVVVERAGKKKIGQYEYTHIGSQNIIWSIYNQLYSKHNETKKQAR